MINKNNMISIVALVFSVIALVMCSLNCGSKSTTNTSSLEETLLAKPELIVNAMQQYEATARERAALEASKLFANNIEAINNNPNSPFVGKKDAKVTLVEFYDYSCGYCHKVYPAIKEIVAKNPDIKVVFKSLAFVSPTSAYAAKATIAANLQGKFIELHNAMFDFEGQLDENSIDELAKKVGLDFAKYKTDLNGEKVASIMKETSELAGKIQVNGVPAIILNGKSLQTLDASVMQAEIDALK